MDPGENRWLLQKLAKAQRARGLPCARCGHPIDYSVADGSTPNSFTYGHIKPKSKYPNLIYDPANGQSEHARCNKSAGDRLPAWGPPRRSRDW